MSKKIKPNESFNRPNVSLRVEKEIYDEINRRADIAGVTRSEWLQSIVLDIIKYQPKENEFVTLTIGDIKNKIMALPDEMPVIAYTNDDDYAISDLNLFGLITGLKITKLNKKIDKKEWELNELIKK